jgi:hypothetical protein
MVLTKYPPATNPLRPVLAAQAKPPAKIVAGMAYSHPYSGGSVARLNRSSILLVMRNPPKMSANFSTKVGEEDRGGTKQLRKRVRQQPSTHHKQSTYTHEARQSVRDG